ncbi:hypothetical protein ACSBR2_042054 [Camellia fascicularis]
MLKIEIISKESIKPSSSTPNHLKTFRLSLLDQFVAPFFAIPVVLYYHSDEEATSHVKQSEMSSILKRSLSDALTLYYPFAGRMKGESSVDCNDEGVDYLEARVDASISDMVKFPQVEVVSQFIPSVNYRNGETSDVQLAIQVTLFNCGGLAIGIGFSHRIADGLTLSTFIKAWAAMASGETSLASPIFISSSIFPPRDPLGFKQTPDTSQERLITRRFCFTSSTIAALKAEVGTCAVHPTRVELVTAVIWKCAMAQSGLDKSTVTHAVNVRGKMDPPLPGTALGNIFRQAYAYTNGVVELGRLVGELREGIGKIDSEYLMKLKSENAYEMIMNNIKKVGELVSNKEVLFLRFTSWCKFPIFEADFGWGKPIWVSSGSRAIKNSVMLMDSMRSDGGIEAWVTMDEESMMKFEQDPLLLSFVSS